MGMRRSQHSKHSAKYRIVQRHLPQIQRAILRGGSLHSAIKQIRKLLRLPSSKHKAIPASRHVVKSLLRPRKLDLRRWAKAGRKIQAARAAKVTHALRKKKKKV